MAAASEESICEALVDEARELITYSPVLDEDKRKPKSKQVMEKNKKGFAKLKQAVAMKQAGWMAHYNTAEFYYNGLDGATPVDETKAVYHYYKAWTLYGNHNIVREAKSSPFSEPILINFAGLAHKIQASKSQDENDENNQYVVDINEVIQLCEQLEDKAQFISYKLLAFAIHARILYFLQENRKDALKYYEQCIALQTKYTHTSRLSTLIADVMKGVRQEMDEIHNSDDTVNAADTESKTCAFCHKEVEKLLRCGRCKSVYYCSIDCQRPHWKKHKKVCKKSTTK